ncbi:acyl-CoA thioesterase [bacterium]|nr:acyl-CoA thioesterase [bacterium]
MPKVHISKQKVYYADTDAYGVVWHGNYIRWMEIARTDFCDEVLNVSLAEMQKQDIILPVASVEIKYKSPAKLYDELIIETSVSEVTNVSMSFLQTIKNAKTGTVCTVATVKVAAVNGQGRLYRSIPEPLKSRIEKCQNDET